jgi:hypothetical protein
MKFLLSSMQQFMAHSKNYSKDFELCDRTTGFIEDSVSQTCSKLSNFTSSGREMIKEINQHSQKLTIEQLDHKADDEKAGKKTIRKS